MTIIDFLLLLAAAICFGLAALNVPARVNWLGLGLLFWVVTLLIKAGEALH